MAEVPRGTPQPAQSRMSDTSRQMNVAIPTLVLVPFYDHHFVPNFVKSTLTYTNKISFQSITSFKPSMSCAFKYPPGHNTHVANEQPMSSHPAMEYNYNKVSSSKEHASDISYQCVKHKLIKVTTILILVQTEIVLLHCANFRNLFG